MKKYKFLTITHLLILTAAFLFIGSGYGRAETENPAKRMTQAQRQAAADRLAAQRLAVAANRSKLGKNAGPLSAMTTAEPGGIPDYVGVANWANSPIIKKFIDTLPGLGYENRNNRGKFIPIAVADTNTYPGSDYYEIAIVEYNDVMHSELPPTRLRGYVQTNTTDPNINTPHYLGPTIIARKNIPVRIKFTNLLPTGSDGDLFIPVDTTVMGAGMGPSGMDMYTQNRATLHLHGGRTPWISDGTPHQWITPADEATPYPAGVSVQNVPDMPDPGPGSMTFFYTNQQSARLMFYHDHSWGITRLNVYVGGAAGYIIRDDTELDLIARNVIPTDEIPLIFQDKSFVDANTVRITDPTWNWGTGTPDANGVRPPVTGDLWYPHVYVPAQNPEDLSGANAYGRWHYGPWFWPPTTGIQYPPVDNPYYDPINAPWQPSQMPGTPNPSMPGESFFDIAVVNGTAYPTLEVQPKAYRFRILNAANDRFFNLSLYVADPCVVSSDGRVNTEVKMVPAAPTAGFPDTWPIDGRVSGVPDPAAAGPSWIQIGTEGGFLPAPAVIAPQPIVWNNNPTTFNFGNVVDHSLLVAPAERADVIVDFSAYRGKTIIVYNDAPAAFPAIDDRYDYYTGAPDLRDTGGYGVTLEDGNTAGPLAGFSPNIRTVMQITVADVAPAAAFDVNTLNAEFASTDTVQGVFERSQPPIIVAQSDYDSAYNKTFPTKWPFWGYARIQDFSMQFKTIEDTNVTLDFETKAIQDEMGEAFDEYGRMSGKLGLELPNTNAMTQNFVLQNYIDPSTENLTAELVEGIPTTGDGTQIWKITHNGVDTHPIHFHLFDVQVLNRVGWDGAIRLPDRNELGWKDTIRVSPLEDTIVALRPVVPTVPFDVPESIRALNPAEPIGSMMGFSNFDPLTGDALAMPTENAITNFGWEYVWHCHILSHEEMDMMRPIAVAVTGTPALALPEAPSDLVASATQGMAQVDLMWMDNANNEAAFRIERATVIDSVIGEFSTVVTLPANTLAYADTTALIDTGYAYRVFANNPTGDSAPSNISQASTLAGVPGAPTAAAATAGNTQATVTFVAPAYDGGSTITGYTVISSPAGGVDTDAGTTATTHTITGLTNGTAYTFTVTATNSAGTGPASNPSNSVTPATLPAAPTIGTATAGNAQATVTFTAPASDGGSAITSYTVTSTPGGITATGSASPLTVTGLTNGTAYTFTVTATNAVGTGPASDASNSVTPVTVPGAPTIGTATAGNAQATVTFTAPASNGGSTITSYTVTSTPGGITATGAASPFTVTGLTNGAAYTFKVTATNAVGTGPASAASNSVVPTSTKPAAPSVLTAKASPVSINNPTVTLAWRDNSPNEAGFTIQRATNTAFTAGRTTFTVGANVKTYKDTAVQPNKRYYYRVRAYNSVGVSAYSNTATVVTPGIRPLAPTRLTVGAKTRTSIALTWTDNATNETGYTIQRATNAAFTKGVVKATVNTPNLKKYTRTGLTRNKTYYFRVWATNAAGNSSYSNVVSAKTLP